MDMVMATPGLDVVAKIRKDSKSMLALAVLILLFMAALLAPLIATHNPYTQDTSSILLPPAWYEGANSKYILGTDDLGRDIFSRLVHGARYSLFLGFVIVFLSLVAGVFIGTVAAFKRGVTEAVILRCIDMMLAIPTILLAIIIVAILGPSLANAALAVSIVLLPHFVRITRAAVISEMTREYVLASRLDGNSGWRLFIRTLLPNISAPLIVQTTLSFSSAILDIAALGFLGLGAQPPTPEWGTLLSSSREYIEVAPWTVTIPGLAILLTVLACNVLGDGLRDALDPKIDAKL
jgi:dipeptide transport system permease protein